VIDCRLVWKLTLIKWLIIALAWWWMRLPRARYNQRGRGTGD